MTHYIAITRAYPANQWRNQPAAALANAIAQPTALAPTSRKALFAEVIQRGGDVAALRQLYQYAAYMADVETALADGDLQAALGLVTMCPVDLGATTLAAIQATLSARTLRVVDVVARERGETAPATITAASVTAALGQAGYTWSGNAWQYAG